MLKIYPSYNNKNIVKDHAKVERCTTTPGMDATFYVYLNNHQYRLDIYGLDYFLIFKDEIGITHSIYLRNLANNSIEIDNVHAYKAGASDKTIHSERLLKKYQQLALMVHGIVASNMLLTAQPA